MRRAKELLVWRELQAGRAGRPSAPFAIGSSESIDLARPCTVLGGRNGSGKSRLLKSIAASLGEDGLYLDLHHLCEQALTVLRSLNKLDEMKDELGRLGPDDKRIDDVRRIVGRDYDSVDWYALDVGPEGKELFRSLRADPAALSEALHVDSAELQRKLDDLEGEDAHDWVNLLGEAYGRAHVLTILANFWADAHVAAAQAFAALVRAGG